MSTSSAMPTGTTPAVDLETYIRIGAAALNLPLEHANIAEIERNLALAFRLAGAFTCLDLADDAEPGPVFNAFAVEPGGAT